MSIEERLSRIEKIMETLVNQEKDKSGKLSRVFEALDGRLTTIENGIVASAGDASQARHNTHQIRNSMQNLVATQVVILERLGIEYDSGSESPVKIPTTPHENG